MTHRNSSSTSIYHLRGDDSLRAKAEALTIELETLRAMDSKLIHIVTHVNSLGPCLYVVELIIQRKSIPL